MHSSILIFCPTSEGDGSEPSISNSNTVGWNNTTALSTYVIIRYNREVLVVIMILLWKLSF